MTDRREEETIARDLHRALAEAFAVVIPDARLSISGPAYWTCDADRSPRSAHTTCFFTGRGPGGLGPEYAISFRLDGEEKAEGRTNHLEEAVAATRLWLEGAEVAELHRRFAFVDRHQRALDAIREEAARARPSLEGLAATVVRPPYGGLHELWYWPEDRTCCVSYYGQASIPEAVLSWDGCAMIRLRVDDAARLARALDRWIRERATPSAMAAEFPEAEVLPVARYYEEGRPIEGEFLLSWDGVESHYRNPRFRNPRITAQFPAVLEMIAAMRRAGYDRTLRAGTSTWHLVLSRSRRYGLRPGQPRLYFRFDEDGGVAILDNLNGGDRTTSFPTVRFTLRMEGLLHRLSTRDVD